MIKEYMNIGEAVDLLKQGKLLSRHAWDTDAFLFLQVPAEIPADTVPKMQSLPDEAKQALSQGIKYRDQIAIVTDCVARGWTPTIQDLLATDWRAVN